MHDYFFSLFSYFPNVVKLLSVCNEKWLQPFLQFTQYKCDTSPHQIQNKDTKLWTISWTIINMLGPIWLSCPCASKQLNGILTVSVWPVFIWFAFFVICFHIIYRAVATATPAVLLAGSELLGSRWRHIWCWWARQRQQIHVHPGAVEAARRLHDRPTPAAFAAAGAMAERRCTRDDANDQAKSVETGGNQVHHIIMAHRAETQWGPSKTQWTLVSQGPARSQWDSDRLGTNCVKGYVTDLEQIVIWCIFFNQYLIET